MIIYLIRHGITQANTDHLYCGSSDLPLSDKGVRVLEQLKEKYSVSGTCRFYTSGMLRTEQTLQILFGDVSHQAVPGLREPDFGVFELHSYEELKDLPEYRRWITGDYMKNIPPSGESGEHMAQRVRAAAADILTRGQDCVIVTHGGVIAVLMSWLFPEEGKNQYEWQPKPGYGYEVDLQKKSFRAIP